MEANQLQLFQQEEKALEIPKGRAVALRRIARNRGEVVASARAMLFDAHHEMTDAIKDRIGRFGSGSPNLYMTIAKQVNSAVGVKSIEDADNGQLGLMLWLRNSLPKAMKMAPNKDAEKKLRKMLCDTVRDMREAQTKILEEAKAA